MAQKVKQYLDLQGLNIYNENSKNELNKAVNTLNEFINTKADANKALYKIEQELTNEELDQVRSNLHLVGKDVTGQEFVVNGETLTAGENAEIFGDYDNNIAIGQWSIAEGSSTVAKGRVSHAEGAFSQALNDGCHVEGYGTKATGYWSHAEGEMTIVSSYASHAEGSYTKMPDGTTRYSTAAGYASHTEGGGCHTNGVASHAEGIGTTANGRCAHVEGTYTIASGKAQHVEDLANIEDTEDKYIHIAGNGVDPNNRSNAYTLDWDGNAWFNGDVYVDSTSGINKDEGSKKLATENYVENLYKKLNSNTVLGFYCIEDVTIITNGISKTYPANSNVEVSFIEDDVFEIVPTSNNSILSLNAWPGALGTFYPWLEGVAQFSNILFDMNPEDMYVKWNQGNQGVYHVQAAQYTNCIFWSDNPYISDVAKRTNYTLTYSSQLPLCYSTIPDNTFKAFYLAWSVNSDPNWSNQAYKDSFAKATWATQVFSYYGARMIGTPGLYDIVLPKDCRGLMFYAEFVENAGTFDATNVTNFGAKSGSWRDAFGYCSSLRKLYIKNLKVNLNVSWSPIDYDSISYIISEAANTNAIRISVSPYTYNLLSDSDFELAASKNITIELLTTNYVEDKRLGEISNKADKSYVDEQLTILAEKQADWNQNDETAADYVKNRTHWVEGQDVLIDIVANTSITCNVFSDYYQSYPSENDLTKIQNLRIEEGKTYLVIFDETDYVCTAWFTNEGGDGACLGNITVCNSWSDPSGTAPISNEPFLLYDNRDTEFNPNNEIFLYTSNSGTHTISVFQMDGTEVIHKLDEKFIPDTIARVSNSEEWVFTLEDGSTITKKVVLG